MVTRMKDVEPVIAKARAERRRYKRVRVDLPGRLFVPEREREARCTVIDLSPGGAAIEWAQPPLTPASRSSSMSTALAGLKALSYAATAKASV